MFSIPCLPPISTKSYYLLKDSSSIVKYSSFSIFVVYYIYSGRVQQSIDLQFIYPINK